MVHLGKMQLEAALLFETIEEIYGRVFRRLRPRSPLPVVEVRFCRYANANSRIRFEGELLRVQISDLLEDAPATIQEALAYILLTKLFRKPALPEALACYRRYINQNQIRTRLQTVKRERGKKRFRNAQGDVYDLNGLFDELNGLYFDNSISKPGLGWSLRPSCTSLGHYDPSHQTIVLSSVLDRKEAPTLIVRYVLYHEMLHVTHPIEHGTLRRCVHTAAFKQAERRFGEFRKARELLKRYVESLA